MQIGISLGITGNRRAGGASYSPNSLFAASEAGDWFDPSDLSRMWQDTAGTTPVTADGQTVARIDGQRGVVSLRQSDAAKRPAYAFAPVTGRRNLLTKTEEFNDAAWSKSQATVTANSGVAPDGTTTSDKLVDTSASSRHYAFNAAGTTLSAAAHTASIFAKAAERGWLYLSIESSSSIGAWFDLVNGTVGTVQAGVTASIVSAGNGWFRCIISRTVTAGTNYIVPHIATADNVSSYAGDGASGILIWGAQLETGSTATAYQKVNTAFGVTEAGAPTIHWLQFDGSDDYMSSASAVNFSASDKLTIAAGVLKSSDAKQTDLVGIGSPGNGAAPSAIVSAPQGTAEASFGGFLAGTTGAFAARTPTTFAAPLSAVLCHQFNISGATTSDKIQQRVNGASAANTIVFGATTSGGNFGASSTLHLGARTTSAFQFTGNIYFLLIRGALTSGADLTALEGFAAARTGITL